MPSLVLPVTLLGRQTKALHTEVLFSYLEIEVLCRKLKKNPLTPLLCLGQTARSVARLVEFLATIRPETSADVAGPFALPSNV